MPNRPTETSREGGLENEGSLGTLGDLIKRGRKGEKDLLATLPEGPKGIKVTFLGKPYFVDLEKGKEKKVLKLLSKVFLAGIQRRGARVGTTFEEMLQKAEAFYDHSEEIKSKIKEIREALSNPTEESSATEPTSTSEPIQSESVLSVDETTFNEWLTRFGKKWKGRVLIEKIEKLTALLNDSAADLKEIQKDYPGADRATLEVLLNRYVNKKKADTPIPATHIESPPVDPDSPTPDHDRASDSTGDEPDTEVDGEDAEAGIRKSPTLDEIKQTAVDIRKEVAAEKNQRQADLRYQRIINNIHLFIRYLRDPERTPLHDDKQEEFNNYYSEYQVRHFLLLLKELGEEKQITDDAIKEDAKKIKAFKTDPDKGEKYYRGAINNLRLYIRSLKGEVELDEEKESLLAHIYRGYDEVKLIALLAELKEFLEITERTSRRRNEETGGTKKERIDENGIEAEAEKIWKGKKRGYRLGQIHGLAEFEGDNLPTHLHKALKSFRETEKYWKVPDDFIALRTAVSKLDLRERLETCQKAILTENGLNYLIEGLDRIKRNCNDDGINHIADDLYAKEEAKSRMYRTIVALDDDTAYGVALIDLENKRTGDGIIDHLEDEERMVLIGKIKEKKGVKSSPEPKTETITPEIIAAKAEEIKQRRVEKGDRDYANVLRNLRLMVSNLKDGVELTGMTANLKEKIYKDYNLAHFLALFDKLGEPVEVTAEPEREPSSVEITQERVERAASRIWAATDRKEVLQKIGKLAESTKDSLRDDLKDFYEENFIDWKLPEDLIRLRAEISKLKLSQKEEWSKKNVFTKKGELDLLNEQLSRIEKDCAADPAISDRVGNLYDKENIKFRVWERITKIEDEKDYREALEALKEKRAGDASDKLPEADRIVLIEKIERTRITTKAPRGAETEAKVKKAIKEYIVDVMSLKPNAKTLMEVINVLKQRQKKEAPSFPDWQGEDYDEAIKILTERLFVLRLRTIFVDDIGDKYGEDIKIKLDILFRVAELEPEEPKRTIKIGLIRFAKKILFGAMKIAVADNKDPVLANLREDLISEADLKRIEEEGLNPITEDNDILRVQKIFNQIAKGPIDKTIREYANLIGDQEILKGTDTDLEKPDPYKKLISLLEGNATLSALLKTTVKNLNVETDDEDILELQENVRIEFEDIMTNGGTEDEKRERLKNYLNDQNPNNNTDAELLNNLVGTL